MQRTLAALLILTATFAIPASGKKVKHPAGFSFEIPGNWKTEDGPYVSTLLPPGVTIDPAREDNPQVYTVYPDKATNGKDVAQLVRDSLSGITLDGGGQLEAFWGKDKTVGTIHTFDFMHPIRKVKIRIRVYEVTLGGRQIALIARGLKDKVEDRDKQLREIAGTMSYE